jgi:excisionase family DNA binding protein
MKPDTKAQRAAAAFTDPTTSKPTGTAGRPVTGRTNQLLTVAEVAEWLRVDPRYVYRLASSGELIRVYIGRYVRIPANSVEAYIDAHTVEAVKPSPRGRRPGPGPRARRRLRVMHNAEQ